MTKTQEPRSALATWWVAVRPFSYTGSALPVVLGVVLAHDAGFSVNWVRFALTLAGIVCYQAAANLLNDCFDHRRGLDVDVNPASGAVVRGWLTDRQAFRGGLLFFLAGTVCGLTLVWLAGWVVLLLGVVGAAFVLGYTRSGVCLKYAGLGDLSVFFAFGPLPVLGAYWVQTEAFSLQPVLWSLPLVAFTVGILHANNWRDIGSDSSRTCRTVANLLGEHGSAVYYRLLILSPFAMVVAYVLLAALVPGSLRAPLTVLVVFAVLPKALALSRCRRADGEGFLMLDARTAQFHLLFGVLLSVAFVVARHLPCR